MAFSDCIGEFGCPGDGVEVILKNPRRIEAVQYGRNYSIFLLAVAVHLQIVGLIKHGGAMAFFGLGSGLFQILGQNSAPASGVKISM